MKLPRLLPLFLLPAAVVAADIPAATRARTLAREAAKAAEAQDHATYLAKMEEAVALRPDYPRMLVNLAAAQVASEKLEEAVATLERLAALGCYSPIDKADEFVPLRERADFKAVLKKIAANNAPRGAGEMAFPLREVTGLIEGIAWRASTGTFYFGDVNDRSVWVRGPKEAKDDKPRRLTPEGDELYGVFGLAIDEARGALWAATSAVSAMRGFTPDQDGTAALAEIDLESGAIRRVIPVVRQPGDQQSHVLGDLALGPDGTVYLPDSGAPIVWQLAPEASALTVLAESPELMSPQGAVVRPEKGVLVVSDYANGLLRIDLASRAVSRMEIPADTTLLGLDGLALAPNGDVLAIQNGVRPNRVLQLKLDASAESVTDVKVLEAGHLQMAAPSLGCLGPGGDFHFIGNAGWTRFENTDAQPTAPRSVPIYKTKPQAEPTKKK